MGRLSDLVNKGVKMIVVDPETEALAAAADAAAERAAPPPPPPAPRGTPAPPTGRAAGRQVAQAAPPRKVATSEVPASVDDFAAVYKEAGIALPPHGYGVDRVAEMLEGKRLATLAREVKATAVLAALEAARVDVQDVIDDGIRRDKALDAFEAAKERELVERKQQNETRVQSLKKDLDELLRKINTEIEKLKQESADAEKAFTDLQVRKRQEEQRLFDVIAHFVEGANPISTGPGSSAPPAPGSRS